MNFLQNKVFSIIYANQKKMINLISIQKSYKEIVTRVSEALQTFDVWKLACLWKTSKLDEPQGLKTKSLPLQDNFFRCRLKIRKARYIIYIKLDLCNNLFGIVATPLTVCELIQNSPNLKVSRFQLSVQEYIKSFFLKISLDYR